MSILKYGPGTSAAFVLSPHQVPAPGANKIGVVMAFGKSRENAAKPTAQIEVHVGSETLSLEVELYGNELSSSAVWATISTYITGGTTTRCMTTDGRYAIVNWPHVQAITYGEQGVS